MRFVPERERQEAQRKRLEAEGIRDAQKLIEEALTPATICSQGIQDCREIAQSTHAKVIVRDGRSPFLINMPDARAASSSVSADVAADESALSTSSGRTTVRRP
jgi:regulator of protease activity HflC (stomatin/prohibitin superfamily)